MSCDVRLLDYNYAWQAQTEILTTSSSNEFPASNLKNFLRSKIFRTSSITGDQGVVFDIKTIEEIDSIVVLPNPLSGFKFSPAVELKVQASATNLWVAPPFEETLVIDEPTQIASLFLLAPESYRFWRISMTDPFNAYGYFELGKVILGRKTDFARVPSIGFSLNTVDLSKIESTPYGHKYFDIYPNIKSLDVELNLMTDTDVYKWLDSFYRVGRVSPVLISLDSQEGIFDKNRFVIYGTYENNMAHEHVVRNRFNMPLVIGEML